MFLERISDLIRRKMSRLGELIDLNFPEKLFGKQVLNKI